MQKRNNWQILFLAILVVIPLSAAASAENFLSALFGYSSSNGESFGESAPLGYAPTENHEPLQPAIKRPAPVSSVSYCVRSCDGKYFPAAVNSATRSEGCSKLCPASETKVFTGSSIDTATGQNGKAYSETTNAYRYRKELVAGCTCNGKTSGGLAAIALADDVTLRKGDLIADANGLRVATRDFQKNGTLQLTTISKPLRILAAR